VATGPVPWFSRIRGKADLQRHETCNAASAVIGARIVSATRRQERSLAELVLVTALAMERPRRRADANHDRDARDALTAPGCSLTRLVAKGIV
jgi:hypothetical protein